MDPKYSFILIAIGFPQPNNNYRYSYYCFSNTNILFFVLNEKRNLKAFQSVIFLLTVIVRISKYWMLNVIVSFHTFT